MEYSWREQCLCKLALTKLSPLLLDPEAEVLPEAAIDNNFSLQSGERAECENS